VIRYSLNIREAISHYPIKKMIDPLSPLGIAETIFSQLGGKGRLVQMVGAKYFTYHSVSENETEASFRFRGSRRCNLLVIKYRRVPDCYTMHFYKYTAPTARNHFIQDRKTIKETGEVYFDQLQEIFERETGLSLSPIHVIMK